MTVINMDFRRPRADGTDVPARGYVEWKPTARRDMEGYILLPKPFKVTLVDGVAQVTVMPTTVDWYWGVTEVFDGLNPLTKFYIVPDSPTAIDYDDLIEVRSPDSGQAVPPSTWQAELDGESSARQSGDENLQNQIDELAPSLSRLGLLANLFSPYSNTLVPNTEVTVSTSEGEPGGWAAGGFLFWNTAGAFNFQGTPGAVLDGSPTFGCWATPTFLGAAHDIEFTITARRFAFFLFDFTEDERYRLWIDERPVSLTDADLSTYTNPYVTIDFGTRQTHHIRIAGIKAFSGLRIETPALDTVWATPDRFKVAVVSDSYFISSNQQGSNAIARKLQTLTGWRVSTLARAGSGYATGLAYGDPARIAEVVSANPDLLIVAGSMNDWEETDIAGYKQTVLDYYAEIEEALPDLPIVVIGVQPLNNGVGYPGTPAGRLAALNTALSEAAAEAPNVVGFIDSYNEDWLTGTGDAGTPTTNGNQDWAISSDEVHPSPLGAAYWAARIAAALKRTLI